MDSLEVMEQGAFGGVIATLWAEGEDGGGAGLDLGDGGAGGEEDLGEQGTGGEGGEGQGEGEGQQQTDDKTDARRGSKEFRDWLKTQEATPEGAKFAKQVRADYYKVQQLAELDPEGINGIRAKYALLESAGGPEAITQLQERVAEVEATDQLIASGDPKGLAALGPDFDPGLAKLTPAILDRVMRADPEAYSAAILPHLMTALAGSPLTGDLNRMIDVMQAPHLDEAGKLKALTGLLARIGQWYQVNEEKAGKLKTAPVDQQRTQFDQERSEFDKQQQVAHWTNNIAPTVTGYEKQKLDEAFKPYATKLRLDAAGSADLFAAFRSKMKEVGQADKAYMQQMAVYHKQKNPDPAVVSNFVKAAINRHYKTVVDGVVKARYGRFLGNTQTRQTQRTQQPGARQVGAPAGGGVTVVAVKPPVEDIDYRRTSESDQWKGVYTLKTGKKVQVRKPA